MKFKGMLVSELSGSAGGITASRNRYGGYLRQKVQPVNPSTPFQATIRQAQQFLTAQWIETLTPSQRAGWDAYAAIVGLPAGGAGDLTFVTGQNMYVRSNVIRIQAGLDHVDDPPTVYDLATFTEPTSFTPSEAAQTADLVFNTDDTWVTEDGAFMAVFVSRPQNVTKNFFKGPYRLSATILGDATTPPTSPATITCPFPFAESNKLFYKCTVGRADARYSLPFRGLGSATS